MARETQQSIFLENTVGELANLCTELKSSGINIKAICVMDSGDFGVVRMVTSDPAGASGILKRRQIPFLETQVVTAELPDRPGALADVAQSLAQQGVNIQYVYGSEPSVDGSAFVVLRVSSPSLAEQILEQKT